MLQTSGGSRIFERGFRFRQITGIARIVSSWQVRMSMQRLRRKNSEFGTFEIASAGFSGLIQRVLVRRSSKLPHLFHHPGGQSRYKTLRARRTVPWILMQVICKMGGSMEPMEPPLDPPLQTERTVGFSSPYSQLKATVDGSVTQLKHPTAG